eukprot:8593841-Alexandrium_andersonii.AAC.1
MKAAWVGLGAHCAKDNTPFARHPRNNTQVIAGSGRGRRRSKRRVEAEAVSYTHLRAHETSAHL